MHAFLTTLCMRRYPEFGIFLRRALPSLTGNEKRAIFTCVQLCLVWR
jgi:hypothetical protein